MPLLVPHTPFPLAEAHDLPELSVVSPRYGRSLDEVAVGHVYTHPRAVELERGMVLDYARTFMEHNPIYLSEDAARARGFAGLPVCPHLLLNVALSLGVQHDSEKTLANLGYWDVRFLRPVYVGETLRAMTRVVDIRHRGIGLPGIVTIETVGLSAGEAVVQFRRKLMLPPAIPGQALKPYVPPEASFPWQDTPAIQLIEPRDLPYESHAWQSLPEVGQVWLHPKGRTITDAHLEWTWRLGNSHPLHNDRVYAQGASGALSGEPIVYGGLVFAWLLGLSSRDLSADALCEWGFHAGFHTQPSVSGDTLYALSRVLGVHPSPVPGFKLLHTQLVGVKNISSEAAWARYGCTLFEREDTKRQQGKAKILDKVFEIERYTLIPIR